MTNDSPVKAVIVVTATALVCSILVTLTAVTLAPTQRAYQDLERIRFLVGVSGLTDHPTELSDREIIALYQTLDPRIVDLDSGTFDTSYNAESFDSEEAAADPTLSVAIPEEMDKARIGKRSKLIKIHFVRGEDGSQRVILPIYGQGMWSTIRGYIALEIDLNTIADIVFYEQAETAGIGDRILRPDWQAKWRGKTLYDDQGTLRFRIGAGSSESAAYAARYQVDAISGATVTSDAVSSMVAYWFGPHGFGPFIQHYRSEQQS